MRSCSQRDLLRWLSHSNNLSWLSNSDDLLDISCALARCGLNTLCLLVVVERLALATDLLDLLVMDIVHTDQVVGQVVMVVVVLDDDSVRVEVVSVDVLDDGSVVLMVDVVLLDRRLERVEVLLDGLGDGGLVVLQPASLASWLWWLLVASVVWWRQSNSEWLTDWGRLDRCQGWSLGNGDLLSS